jgi:hypothetical protein
MERLFSSLFFIVVLLNALLILINPEKLYHKYAPNIHSHIATVREASNRITRNCSSVVKIQPDSSDWKVVEAEFRSRLPGAISTTRGILKRDDWFMAEVELTDTTPMILLFTKSTASTPYLQGYSAAATDVVDPPAIRDFFLERIPAAPKDLIRCYDPMGYPFNVHLQNHSE